MSRIGDFVMGAICGGGFTVGAMNYHVVRAEDGFHVIRKLTTGIEEPYVDVRGFTASDWTNHRSLAAAIVRAGKGEILSDTSLSGFRNAIEGWVDGLGAKRTE